MGCSSTTTTTTTTPCAACCAAINKLYPRLYQTVRIATTIPSEDKNAFLTQLIVIAQSATSAIYQEIKCRSVTCCTELIEGIFQVFKVYINLSDRTEDDLIVFINLILVPSGFPAITSP